VAGVVGIVLAAGASRRAGCVKALALLDGRETLVARAVRTLREAGAEDVTVVIAPPHGAHIARSLRGAARLIESGEPERGMLWSLSVALAAALPDAALPEAALPDAALPDAAIVAHVDRPRVRTATVRALIEGWRATGADLVEPIHAGRRGHPWLASRALLATLRDAPPERGARPILRAVTRRHAIEVDDPAVLESLDTASDLARAGILPPPIDAVPAIP
jgi:molybdenum cofactor cytidylyltransferase